jgi:hypothetical protein
MTTTPQTYLLELSSETTKKTPFLRDVSLAVLCAASHPRLLISGYQLSLVAYTASSPVNFGHAMLSLVTYKASSSLVSFGHAMLSLVTYKGSSSLVSFGRAMLSLVAYKMLSGGLCLA